MTVYEENLKSFKEKSEVLYNVLIENKPLFDVGLESVEGQPLNAMVSYNGSKCFVHSAYNIEAELQNMVKDISKDTDTVVLFGLGYGHIIPYLAKHFPKALTFVIVEPALCIFRDLISKVNFMEMLTDNSSIDLIINKTQEEVVAKLNPYFLTFKNIALIEHVSYRTMFNSFYQHIFNNLTESLRSQRYNLRALFGGYLDWARGSVINIQRKTFMIESLFKYLEGKPAVIVSAGPSLNKNMHLLSKLKDKAVMFAGGSSIKVLSSMGLVPDFRVSIDAKSLQIEMFKNVDDSAPLIFRNMSNPDVVGNYNGALFRATIEDDYLWRYICKKNEIPTSVIRATPSVSNFTFELLKEAKCNPIIFVGQDMCSYGGDLYAKGREDIMVVSDSSKIEMIDIFGNKVTTELVYLQIKYSYDSQTKGCNLRLINATEGGLGIEGTEIKSLESVLEEDLIDDKDFDIEEIIEIEQLKHAYEDLHVKSVECMKEVKAESQKVIEIYYEVFTLLNKYEHLKKKNYKKGRLRSELDYIETIQKKLDDISFYTEVVAPSTDMINYAYDYRYKQHKGYDLEAVENRRDLLASKAETNYKYCMVIRNT